MRWVRAIVITIVVGAGAGTFAALWEALAESGGVVVPTPSNDALPAEGRGGRAAGEGTPGDVDVSQYDLGIQGGYAFDLGNGLAPTPFVRLRAARRAVLARPGERV